MKQNLLWIGKSCPNPFQSAGDKRSLDLIRILIEKYNVTTWFTSANFGYNDVKALGATPVMNGDPKVFDEIFQTFKPDIIIISHWTCGKRYIDYIRSKTNCPIILDTIDLEFLRIRRECEWKQIPCNHKIDAELDIYMKADSLIMASEIDKQELLKYLPKKKMTVIPCLIELDKKPISNSNNVFTVCNWLHQPNVDATIWLCEKIMPFVDAKISLVGKHPPASITKFASAKVEMSGWIPNMSVFCDNMAALLAPILYGAGSNGKISLAGSMGIPIITTSYGADPWGLTTESAMIANTPEEYREAVSNILLDKTKAKRIADNAFDIFKKYTIEAYKEIILGLGD